MVVWVNWFQKLLKNYGWFYLLARVSCIFLFSLQTYKLVEDLVAPTLTHTTVREVPLNDIDFPLDIKICVRPSMNETAVKMFGYRSIEEYIIGSLSNSSLVGWGGLSKDHTTKSTREVFNEVKLNFIEDAVLVTSFTKQDVMTWRELFLSDLEKTNRLHACHIFTSARPNRKALLKGMQSIGIYFNEMKQTSSIELTLQGHGLILNRDQQSFFSSGDNLKVESKRLSKFIVKIKETVLVEEGQRQTCRNYPTREFASYADCDDQYIRKRIEMIAPGMNLTPVWINESLDSRVTTQPLHTNEQDMGPGPWSTIP